MMKKYSLSVKQTKVCVIGYVLDKVKAEGGVWNETNYRNNSRHFSKFDFKKAINSSYLTKERKEETRKGKKGRREEGKVGRREGRKRN